jgi:hypothetical protein
MDVGRRLIQAVVVAVVAAVVAACGSSNEPYTPRKTSPCLRKLGYRVLPPRAEDVIANTAENGGLRAVGFGNTLTIAFGVDARDGLRLARAYRRQATTPGQRELIQPKRNAVLVWTIAPTFAQQDAAQKCLR